MTQANTDWISNVQYSGYRPGDETRLVSFFQECGYEHTVKFWRWINRSSPGGDTMVNYAELHGRVISHYSVLPVILRIGDRDLHSGLGIHLASHPQYRSIQVVMNVVKQVYEICQEARFEVIFGFPNDNSWLLLQRLLGWQAVADIPALEVPLERLLPSSRHEATVRFSPLELTELHASLLRQCAPAAFVQVSKSAEYLNWRYRDHPLQTYHLLERRTDSSLQGFLVLKLYEKYHTKYGHILEWGVAQDDHMTLYSLINSAAQFFYEHSVQTVSTWMNENHPFFTSLRELGFRPEGFTTHFGYKPVGLNTLDLNNRRWFLRMGDSDAF